MYLLKTVTLLLLISAFPFCFANNALQLSTQEQLFIKNNPVITLGGGESFAPFIFKNENGYIAGYDRDIANLIEQKTGLRIEFKLGVWADIQQQAKQGLLDGLSSMVITQDRTSIYNFSSSYLTYTAIAVVNRANHKNIYQRDDVHNKIAAVQRGNEGFKRITESLGDVKIVYYDNIYAVLNAVVNNEVDFTVLDESIYYVANKIGVSDFISTSFVIDKDQFTYFAFSKNKPLLTSIINKALNDISPSQFSKIKSHWFAAESIKKIHFTDEEKAYLRQLKVLKYCINPNLYPIESNENGNHVGVSADFLKEFQRHLPIPLIHINTDSLTESFSSITEQKCDLLTMVMKTKQREEFLNFSTPYFSTPLVIATTTEIPFIEHLDTLSFKDIGIVRNSAYSEILKQQYPSINIIEVNDIQEGLSKVQRGELYGFLGGLSNISYQFQEGYSNKLKITGKFTENWSLSVATRKGDQTLHRIVSKLVTTIDAEKQRNALNKYISINYEGFVDYSFVYTIATVFFITLLLILLWNQRLQKSKESLNKHFKQLEIQKNNIQENERRLEIILQHGQIGNWELNLTDFTAHCSLIHNQIFGYATEAPNWNYELFLHHVIGEDKIRVDNKFQTTIMTKADLNYECRIKRKDGEVRWILGSGGYDLNTSGKKELLIGIVQDITERKEIEIANSRHHAELQSIFNALPDIYFRMQSDGTIVDYHAQNENQLYLNPNQFIGKRMQNILPENIGMLFQSKLHEFASSSSPLLFNYDLTVKNERSHFEARFNKILNNNHIVCVIRDITAEFKSKASLAISERHFRMVFEQAAIGVALVDMDSGKFTRVNQQLASMLGYTIQEMIEDNTVKSITHPDDQQKSVDYMLLVASGEHRGTSLEKRYLHKDGHIIWSELTISSSVQSNQQSLPIIAIVQDITSRKMSDEKLKLAANVFTHAAEGIVITDASGTIIDVNGTFTTTTGYSRAEAIGENPRFLQSGRQEPSFYKAMWKGLKEKGIWSGEVWNRRKNNEVYAEMLNISSVKDINGKITNYVGLFSDITQMKEHQHQLEHTARYDLLTNLPNRSLLADRLSQAMLQCRRYHHSVAVVFLDLDGFKAVNDKHGHDVGDELLVALSSRMAKALREGDTLARIGGDEFVAVLTNLEKIEACEPVLDRLLLANSQPITVNNIVLNISSSIGVTLYPQDNVNADQLVRHADQAMYIAKESGKNRYHLFDTAHDDAVKAQRESLQAIRYALDMQQFVLYYQPKVNMRTGTITGVEALIRWQHPTRGLLNPIEFLPAIENDPMSIELGEWVINEALLQISQWQKMGLKIPVNTSVNISATQLQQPGFTQCLSSLLAEHPDVMPQHLELEVLETSALDDLDHASKTMKACIKLGVKFSIDDFGTGYSSLTYLRRLPASLIKIDQSFVRDMLHDIDDLAIVEAVIALAKSFKLEVIAEGVETVEHGSALLKLGCELAQGYGIAKPMPADAIPCWMINWKSDASWQRK